MLQSMTGYGKAEGRHGDRKITVEIKSLNSKQLDINMRLPAGLRSAEQDLRKVLAELLTRGKLEVSLHMENGEAATGGLINEELALAYYTGLRDVALKAGSALDASVWPALLTLPDLLSSDRDEPEEALLREVQRLMRLAGTQLQEFRANEGARLAEDINLRLELIQQKLAAISPQLEERRMHMREKLEKNLAEYSGRDGIDKDRFEQELIYYLEKWDITEECVRLQGHCKHFRESADAREPQGRKLGFIAQEMGREINTIGAKANHLGIQKLVVEMKDELEKIKEQVLNIL